VTDAPVRRGLLGKLARTLLFSLFLVGGLTSVVLFRLEVERSDRALAQIEGALRQALESRGRTLSASQALAFVSLVETHALTDMQELVERTLSSDEDLVYGVFVSNEQRVLAFASQAQQSAEGRADWPDEALELVRSPVTRRLATATRHFAGQEVLEFSRPVMGSDEQLGTIRYGLSTQSLHRAIDMARVESHDFLVRTLGYVFGITSLVTALGLWLSLRQARRITRPVLELAAASERFATAGETIRVEVDSNDELQTLGEAFSNMSVDLLKSMEQLTLSRDALLAEVEERKRAEAQAATLQEQLHQAQKLEAVGQLAGGVAHDFNNLLLAIGGSAELLRDGLQGSLSAEDEELFQEIEQSCEQAALVTGQLLAFGRRGVHLPRVASIVEMMSRFRPVLRRLVSETIEFEVELSPDTPQIYIDPGRLEQVILNLALNARDAMPNGGKLGIASERVVLSESRSTQTQTLAPGVYMKVSVSDTGVGIEPEVFGHLFEPFFTTKEVGRGTGLGLATVHGIVMEAGGAIDVRSRLGEGTTFEVWLREHSQDASAPISRGGPRIAPARGEHLLVCEDDRAVNRFLTSTLERHGYRVTSFAQPDAVIAFCDSLGQRPAALVTDVVMPKMNGSELATQLRTRWPDLPVAYVSGYTDGVLIDHGFDGELDDVLLKPFSRDQLLGRVGVLLSQTSLAPRQGNALRHE